MFNCIESKIYNLFNQDNVFEVPDYQRKFVWDVTQWKQMISDINSSAGENDETFFGTIVLDKKENNTFDVIDGQQRITSFMCLFIAAIAYLKSHYSQDLTIENRDSIIKNLYDYLVKDNGTEQKKIRLLNDFELFQNLVDEISKSTDDEENKFSIDAFLNILNVNAETKYSKAIQYFFNEFSNRNSQNLPVINFSEFYNKMRISKLVKVEADNTSDAYNVFEILNARGVQLTQIELLKAYILKKTKNDNTHFTSIKSKFENIQRNISPNELDNFLLHAVKCIYNYSSINSRNIYSVITSKHSNFTIGEHVLFVDKLVTASTYYKDYQSINLNALSCRENLISFCSCKNIKIYRPLFLALDFKKALLGDYYSKLFNYLYRFAVLNVLNKTYSHSFDKDLSKAANKVFYANSKLAAMYHFFNFFKNKIFVCNETKVRTEIKNFRYSNKTNVFNNSSKALIHILKDTYNAEQRDMVINYDTKTIEHILNDGVDKDYKTQLGNLLIVDEHMNSDELLSKPYSEKRNIYLSSDINYVKRFANENITFSEEDCTRRTEVLENDIISRFVINENDLSEKVIQIAKIIKMNNALNRERFNHLLGKDYSEIERIIDLSDDLSDEEKQMLKSIYSEDIVFDKNLERNLNI